MSHFFLYSDSLFTLEELNPNIYGFSTKNISCPEFIKLANNLEHFLPDSMLNIPIKHVNQIPPYLIQITIMENNKRDNE